MVAEDFYRVLGRNIRQHRLARQRSLERQAAKLGVSYQQLQKYEKGTNRMPSHMLALLAAEFGCSIDELCCIQMPDHSPDLVQALQRLNMIKSRVLRRHVLLLIDAVACIEEADDSTHECSAPRQ